MTDTADTAASGPNFTSRLITERELADLRAQCASLADELLQTRQQRDDAMKLLRRCVNTIDTDFPDGFNLWREIQDYFDPPNPLILLGGAK